MLKTKISIIIPVFNVESYLNRCIDSILKQKYNEFELILVDDGSTDSSGKICDDYMKIDNRIKAYHKTNGGVSSARNLGIEKCTGEYITFVDSDDYLSENYLIDMAIAFDDKTDMVVSGCIIVDEQENKHQGKQNKNSFLSSQNFKKDYLLEKYDGCCWGKMYKTQLVKSIKFDEEMSIGEDLKFIIKYVDKSKNIKVIDRYNYYYFERQNSLIRKEFNEEWLKEIEFCIKMSENDLSNKKYYLIRKNRTIIDLLWRFDINKSRRKELKKELKRGFVIFLTNRKVSLKYKIKQILVMIVR